MADSFDPFSEWLGLAGGSRPPNLYRLLGLKLLESDVQVITRAADAAWEKVRRVAPGEHQAEWKHLLDQIRATKTFLLNPEKKKAYDQKLQAQRRAALAKQPSPAPAAAVPKKTEPIVESNDFFDFPNEEIMAAPALTVPQQAAWTKTSKPASFQLKPIYFGAGALCLVLVAGIFFLLGRSGSSDQPATPPPVSAENASSAPLPPMAFRQVVIPSPTSKKTVAETSQASKTEPPFHNSPRPLAGEGSGVRAAGSKTASQASPATPSAESKTAAEKLSQELSPVEKEEAPVYEPDLSTEFARTAHKVRLALVDRDLQAAIECLKEAETQAETESDREQIDRLKMMHEYLTQFWDGIQASILKLQAAEEIILHDSPIVVVDNGENKLIVKVAGKVHRFQLKTLPFSLVMALVKRSFGKDLGTKAIVAAFLAVDPAGDRQLARQYWSEAATAGIETEKLLPEVSLMPPPVKRPKK